MKPYFADTFYFLALGNPADAAHQKARSFSKNHRIPLVLTAWVLTELGDALAVPKNRGRFLDLLAILQVNPKVTIIPPDQSLWERGVDLYAQRPDKEWSLTDCISFVVMSELGLTDALTGDHHFEQAGFRALLK